MKVVVEDGQLLHQQTQWTPLRRTSSLDDFRRLRQYNQGTTKGQSILNENLSNKIELCKTGNILDKNFRCESVQTQFFSEESVEEECLDNGSPITNLARRQSCIQHKHPENQTIQAYLQGYQHQFFEVCNQQDILKDFDKQEGLLSDFIGSQCYYHQVYGDYGENLITKEASYLRPVFESVLPLTDPLLSLGTISVDSNLASSLLSLNQTPQPGPTVPTLIPICSFPNDNFSVRSSMFNAGGGSGDNRFFETLTMPVQCYFTNQNRESSDMDIDYKCKEEELPLARQGQSMSSQRDGKLPVTLEQLENLEKHHQQKVFLTGRGSLQSRSVINLSNLQVEQGQRSFFGNQATTQASLRKRNVDRNSKPMKKESIKNITLAQGNPRQLPSKRTNWNLQTTSQNRLLHNSSGKRERLRSNEYGKKQRNAKRRTLPSSSSQESASSIGQKLRSASHSSTRCLRVETRGRSTFSDMVRAGIIKTGQQVWAVGHDANVPVIVNADGSIVYKESSFHSISSFALAVIRERNPCRLACDGWKDVKYEGKRLDTLREMYLYDTSSATSSTN